MSNAVATGQLDSPRTMRPTPIRLVGLGVFTCLLYVALAILGREAILPAVGVSLFWPPTAFGLAMVARFRGAWLAAVIPALIAGEFLADLYVFAFPVGVIWLFVLANGAEQITAGLAIRFLGAQRLATIRDLIMLPIVSACVFAVSALLGAEAGVLTFGGTYQDSWRSWYLGALTAVVVVAPFFLTVSVARVMNAKALGEFVVVIGAVVAVMLGLLSSSSPSLLLAAAFIGPLLGWLGIRFGITAASAAASAVVYFSALSATQSRGLLAPISGQIGMIMATQMVLVLFFMTIYAAAIVERARIAALIAERDANDQLQMMFSDSPIPICRVASEAGVPGQILEANDAFAAMLAGTVADLVGLNLADLFGPDLDQLLDDGADDTSSPNEATELDPLAHADAHNRQLVRLDGSVIRVSVRMGLVQPQGESHAGFFMLFAQDITARYQARLELEHQANHDPLTDLPNRYALLAATQAMLEQDQDDHTNTTLLLCDLDNFKDLNDSSGHSVGDAVLMAVAGRLRSLQDEVSIIARSGGDEFVLVMRTDDEAHAVMMGTRVRTAISDPILVVGQAHTIGVSIGIARSEPDTHGVGDLLRRADLALYSAKESGRNRTVTYSHDMEARLQTQVEMQAQIRLALAEDRIECWFQPVVDAASGQIASAEALVRLRQPDGSILFPDSFIDIAEASGLISQLGDRVLRLSLQWLVRQQGWPAQPAVAVNVSVRQLD
ncbi:MAG: diguanylate cyclase, partial [Actinomycetes bacterium]